MLNDFFASVFTNESSDDIPIYPCVVNDILSEVEVSADQIQKALHDLNPNKSPGPDEIHPRVLKELAKELAYPLKLLFDKSFDQGIIPSDWKEAEVRPLFKKGEKSNPGNYRPVSLTSVVCKVFEGFIRDALCDHLKLNKLLSENQYGFCKGRSCGTQLLTTLNDWLTMLDEGMPVDAVYLDFRKAFDSVPHLRLLRKLEGYGIGGKLLAWVKDFLNDRTQFVSVSGMASPCSKVTSGVPQGSVLGPTLFVYYINDLSKVVDCNIKIFADDTKAYAHVSSLEMKDKLQKSIDSMMEWTQKWLLRFNSEKCHLLHLGKNNPNYDYYMNDGAVNNVLQTTESEKDLGVWMDPLLDFDTHINEVVKKANSISGMITRGITYKSKEVMIPLFKALIRPILEYMNYVWCPYLRKHIDLIENVQRKFTKRIVGFGHLEYEQRLLKLSLPSLEYRRLRGDLIEVYKIMCELYDPVTTDTLFTKSDITKTRGHKFKLEKPALTNTQSFLKFFTNRVINAWNDLPSEAVNASTINAFKNSIDIFFAKILYDTNFDVFNLKLKLKK